MNTNKDLTKNQKDKFFHQMENSEDFFNEVFQALLTFVISDPRLVLQVARAIKMDYQDLYVAILENQRPIEKRDIPVCCRNKQG